MASLFFTLTVEVVPLIYMADSAPVNPFGLPPSTYCSASKSTSSFPLKKKGELSKSGTGYLSFCPYENSVTLINRIKNKFFILSYFTLIYKFIFKLKNI